MSLLRKLGLGKKHGQKASSSGLAGVTGASVQDTKAVMDQLEKKLKLASDRPTETRQSPSWESLTSCIKRATDNVAFAGDVLGTCKNLTGLLKEPMKDVLRNGLDILSDTKYVGPVFKVATFVWEWCEQVTSNSETVPQLGAQIKDLASYWEGMVERAPHLRQVAVAKLLSAIQILRAVDQQTDKTLMKWVLSPEHERKLQEVAKMLDDVVDELLLQTCGEVLGRIAPLPFNPALKLPDSLVGMGQKNEVMRKLQLGSSVAVSVVLVHGMGGIGKTQLANAVYESVRNKGGYLCCLIKLGENATEADVVKQQIDFAKQLGVNIPQVTDTAGCLSELEKALQAIGHQKVFLRLDDVWDPMQLPFVVPVASLPAGSRVVLTARSGDVTQHLKGCDVSEHSVQFLRDQDARQLLSYHVCGNLDGDLQSKLGRYISATKVDELLDVLGGHPLAITVVGSRVARRPAVALDVMDELRSLSGKTYQGLQSILQKTADALTNSVKEAFVAVAFLRGSGWLGVAGSFNWKLEELVAHGLVERRWEARPRVWVHDLVADEARRRGKGMYVSEICDVKDGACVIGARVDGQDDAWMGVLFSMTKLRYLAVRNIDHGTLCMLMTHITLKYLDLSNCSSLVVLPESLGSLVALQTLDLGFCSSLAQLPDGISALTGLQTLDLAGCSSLAQLPDGISALTGL